MVGTTAISLLGSWATFGATCVFWISWPFEVNEFKLDSEVWAFVEEQFEKTNVAQRAKNSVLFRMLIFSQ